MIKAHFSIALTGLAAALLSACAASDDRYPSLAVRDAERVQGTLTPSPNASLPSDDAVQDVEITDAIKGAVTRAYDLSVSFDLEKGDVLGLVNASRGRGEESDARARALVGMASLVSLRGQTAITLADLDKLEADTATRLGSAQDIRAAQAQVTTFIERQDKFLDSLSQKLSQ